MVSDIKLAEHIVGLFERSESPIHLDLELSEKCEQNHIDSPLKAFVRRLSHLRTIYVSGNCLCIGSMTSIDSCGFRRSIVVVGYSKYTRSLDTAMNGSNRDLFKVIEMEGRTALKEEDAVKRIDHYRCAAYMGGMATKSVRRLLFSGSYVCLNYLVIRYR